MKKIAKLSVLSGLLAVTAPCFAQSFGGIDFAPAIGAYSLQGEGNASDCAPNLHVSIENGHPPAFYQNGIDTWYAAPNLAPITSLLISKQAPGGYQSEYGRISFYRPNGGNYTLVTGWGRRLPSRILSTGTAPYVSTLAERSETLSQAADGVITLKLRSQHLDAQRTRLHFPAAELTAVLDPQNRSLTLQNCRYGKQ